MVNFDKVADKIFSIIKGYGHDLIMYADNGNETSNPEEGRWFFVKEPNYMISLNDEERTIKFNRNKNIPLEELETLIKHIKQLGQSHMLNVQIKALGQDFEKKPAVNPTDFSYEIEKKKGRGDNMGDVMESTGTEMWRVHIPANIYDGKYYDHRTVPVNVSKDVAPTEQDAVEYVNNNKEKFLSQIDKKRMKVGDRSIRYVQKPTERNVFFRDHYHVRSTTLAPRLPSTGLGPLEETVELVGDIVEASLSRLHGSTKTSYQTLESVKVIIRHRQSVDEEKRGSRSRAIQSIFLEKAGERFRFPHNHLPGARAMARHMYEGGDMSDVVGQHIIESTGDYIKLREFYKYAKSNKLINENSEDVIKTVRENIDELRTKLGRLSGAKSYGRVKEEIETNEKTVIENEQDDSLVDLFTVKKFDERIGDILPLVNRLVTEKKNWKAKIEEASKEKFVIYREELSEDDLFEFDNPIQKLGYKIRKVSERVQEETSLSKFVGRIGNKLVEGNELSDFEKKVVRNVLENLEEIDKPKQNEEGLDVIESITESLSKKLSKLDGRFLFSR